LRVADPALLFHYSSAKVRESILAIGCGRKLEEKKYVSPSHRFSLFGGPMSG
jgi:hypothetical protein